MKIARVSLDGQTTPRSLFWEEFLGEYDVQVENVCLEPSEVKAWMRSYSGRAVAVEEGLEGAFFELGLSTTVFLNRCRSADFMVFEAGHWRAENVLNPSIQWVFSNLVRELDTRGVALVIGETSTAKVLALTLAQMGFSRVVLSPWEPEELVSLGRGLFGTEIMGLSRQEVTEMQSCVTLTINTLEAEREDALKEYSYLNFLRRPSVVVEMARRSDDQFLAEARSIADLFVESWRVWGMIDFFKASRYLLPKTSLDLDGYLARWQMRQSLS